MMDENMLAHVYYETHRNSKIVVEPFCLPRCKTFNFAISRQMSTVDILSAVFAFAAHENAKCKIGPNGNSDSDSHKKNNNSYNNNVKSMSGQMQFAAATRTKG